MTLKCDLCGVRATEVTWPLTFLVPDHVWAFYIPPPCRRLFICLGCWKKIVAERDQGAYQAVHGLPAGWPSGYPLPPGGYEELDGMTEPQVAEWYARAAAMSGFRWLGDLAMLGTRR
jgi:hypothetical protein